MFGWLIDLVHRKLTQQRKQIDRSPLWFLNVLFYPTQSWANNEWLKRKPILRSLRIFDGRVPDKPTRLSALAENKTVRRFRGVVCSSIPISIPIGARNQSRRLPLVQCILHLRFEVNIPGILNESLPSSCSLVVARQLCHLAAAGSAFMTLFPEMIHFPDWLRKKAENNSENVHIFVEFSVF